MRLIQFIKNWTLPISMTTGAVGYLLCRALPFSSEFRHTVNNSVDFIQPILLFSMLFVSFCKVNPAQLRISKWHVWLLLIQVLSFALLSLPLLLFPDTPWRVVIEGGMICLITPTATAAAVVTNKLGGNSQSIVAYTILINLVSAAVIPVILPIVHPTEGMTFLPAFILILRKVFPILILPLLMAWAVRVFMPRFHTMVLKPKDLAFHLWAVALALAIAVTVRNMINGHVGLVYEAGIALISAASCALQFALGKMIGKQYGEEISAGQALGQKNTVFSIWLGNTFLTPVTSLAGGFYSIWHNLFNSYQLYKERKN